MLSQLEDLMAGLSFTEPQSLAAISRRDVPALAGVYRIYRDGLVTYVGESSNLKARVYDQHSKDAPTSQFGTKLRLEDPNRSDEQIRNIVANCTFSYCLTGENQAHRRRVECLLLAVDFPRLNFLDVRGYKKTRDGLINEMLAVADSGDDETLISLSRKQRALKPLFDN